MTQSKYVMTISRMTVDKLGVKLYDRVSAVIAELVANSYDADARTVTIEAPMGTFLASMQGGKVTDHGHKIVVSDDGVGMVPDVINAFYLKVGGERRKDVARGNLSPIFRRRVMGRKGVGKLAPFGICGTIEVISAGGDLVTEAGPDGRPTTGFRTAHFFMSRDDIISDEDEPYEPTAGPRDRTLSPARGTTLVLTNFIRRHVPEMADFSRQLSQRFGIQGADWQVRLVDNQLAQGTEGREGGVGEFSIERMENTDVRFLGDGSGSVDVSQQSDYQAIGADGTAVPGMKAGFVHSNGRFYPVLGWVAYAKQSYRDDLMAGIRIYCRGKIAAQTSVFNRKSGFTGEYNVRTYLVGELHADWLDEEEDLIQTDRRDILWSDDLGQAFEAWGREVVALLGTRSREPLKKAVWQQFLETGDVANKVVAAYPGERWKSVRDTTMKIARMLGERLRPGEAEDVEHVESLVQLSLMLGPHVELDEQLSSAAATGVGPLGVVANILRTARVAELSSYGMIADKRVKVIEKITELKDDPATLEDALQDSIEEAPWLINPQWSPITANQTLQSLKDEFTKYYKERTGQDIYLEPFDKANRRPDFVLSSQDGKLQIIEIKRPKHGLQNDEWDRIQVYIDAMDAFLRHEGHKAFHDIFAGFRVTLVCDELKLTGSPRAAFNGHRASGMVEYITWSAFLLRTSQTHKEFLAEAERQKRLALGS